MADTFSTEFRSAIMRKVKHKGNKSTEQRLMALFKENGIKGWRRNYKVIGKPDFVFLNQRIAVFADGCFWHGHDCRNTKPKQNASYWQRKQSRNRHRDEEINNRFHQRGWKVIRFWECDIKSGNLDLGQFH
jgi:DNA mismatch endonuclease, patch repair protein